MLDVLRLAGGYLSHAAGARLAHRGAQPVRPSLCLFLPASQWHGDPFSIPYLTPFHAHRHDATPDYTGRPATCAQARKKSPICARGEPLFRAANHSRRRRLELCRRSAADRRWLRLARIGDTRLSAGAVRTRRRRAAAERLWRQDHDLSTPRRRSGRLLAVRCPSRAGPAWTHEAAAARR